MIIRRIFGIAAAALLLAAATGCESFRNGDRPEKEKKSKKSARGNKRSSRDPRDDMFFGIGTGAKAQGFSSNKLNSREKQLLDDEFKRQDEEMRDMRRLHREMDSDRSKRQEWVYGFKPLGSDR